MVESALRELWWTRPYAWWIMQIMLAVALELVDKTVRLVMNDILRRLRKPPGLVIMVDALVVTQPAPVRAGAPLIATEGEGL